MRTRRLVLTKETLTELRAEELLGVVGAAMQITPIAKCVDDVASKVVNCYTVFKPCPTR